MKRKPIIAGNWKMNKTLSEAQTLADEIKSRVGSISGVDMVLCPPFINLETVQRVIRLSSIKLGAQNMYLQKSGAFTGEISADMLKSVGCTYVILGHSERRQYFNETNEIVNQKVKFALQNGLIPIMCCGETLAQREKNETFKVIEEQIIQGLQNLSSDIIQDNKELVIAYEPIWAIGTGKVATPDQAQEVHAFIRQKLAHIFSVEIADKIRIQYGGSVTPDNIKDLIIQTDIDGALVGGASLKADSFATLITSSQP